MFAGNKNTRFHHFFPRETPFFAGSHRNRLRHAGGRELRDAEGHGAAGGGGILAWKNGGFWTGKKWVVLKLGKTWEKT